MNFTFGVIEVKTFLDKKNLIDGCEKIYTAKRLPKKAYLPSPLTMTRTAYGKEYDYIPTAGVILAMDGLEMQTLGQHFADWRKDRDLTDVPDSI